MEDRDFWQLIYAAAINNNHSTKVASGLADDAVEQLAKRWPK